MTRRGSNPAPPFVPGTAQGVSEPTSDTGGIQQSGKHGPLLDEELEHETRGLVQGGRSTRAEEFRDPEPAGEDQPTGDRIYPEDRRGNPEGMTQDDVDERTDIARSLGTSAFPGDRDSLVAVAQENEATDHVCRPAPVAAGGPDLRERPGRRPGARPARRDAPLLNGRRPRRTATGYRRGTMSTSTDGWRRSRLEPAGPSSSSATCTTTRRSPTGGATPSRPPPAARRRSRRRGAHRPRVDPPAERRDDLGPTTTPTTRPSPSPA